MSYNFGMEDNYIKKIHERILARDTFVRAVFTGQQKGAEMSWVKLVVRPVELKDGVHLQFSFFDEKKDISKNYTFEEAPAKINEALALPFRNIFVENTTGSLQVNFSKKGKALLNERKSTALHVVADLSHNREKNRLLSAENAKPYLEAVGILTKDGRIKADMQRKYTQINEFLRLVNETDALNTFAGKPVHVVDFGCGSAYLTFALYYYLHDILQLDAHITGVDIKSDLIERLQKKTMELGWDQLSFKVGTITSFEPDVAPDIVVALHACDTATDDALAKAIRWESKLIFCAPCCQHDLQVQMAQAPAPTPLVPVLSHGILFERLGDILTDTFRAALLRILGYRTDVTQFVPIEHTAKNLMIRSVKTSPPGHNPRWLEEYKNLKNFWQVTPYLEKILGDEYAQYL
ncbi:MAG: SAM-dependent methyltransferase [Anaerolineales bacterium]|nr:SAM-dependent methyltransferase [Anaerolineales bacterium]MCB9144850.1 SAM-dependent methyltransferase [Anaerolineales bacterium]